MVTIESTVPFVDPQGNAIINGLLILDLSQQAMITSGGGQIAPNRVAIVLDNSGSIPAATTIYANDELTPSGTGYFARLYNENMSLVADFGAWVIIGTSPIDLSQEVATTLSVSYPTPGLLAENNTWTGTNQFGSSGTALSQIRIYSQTLTPSAVNTNTSAEQTFTVTGLATTDKVFVCGPSPTAGTGIGNARVSATDTLALTFVNAATSSKTPASGTYVITAIRS